MVDQPILDLNHRHWVARRGGLTAIGTWVRAGYPIRWRPCMAIIRTDDEGDFEHDRCRPCVVQMDNAWIFSEEIGDATMAGDILGTFIVALRLDPADYTALYDLIRFHLQDLVEMPPREAFIKEPADV